MMMNFFKRLSFILLCICCGCRQSTLVAEEIAAEVFDSATGTNWDSESIDDSESEVPSETEDVDTESSSGTISDSDSETDSETEIDTGTPTDSDSQMSTDTGSDSDVPTDTGSDSEVLTDTGSDSDTVETCGVPSVFSWTARAELLSPDIQAGMIAIKDPTAVIVDSNWQIYATLNAQDSTGLGLIYMQGADWGEVTGAERFVAESNPNLTTYKAAPQLFFFSPRQEWYLVYQAENQVPAYSTSGDPTEVMSWSALTEFVDVPQDSEDFGWDYWVICDESNCYLFFTRFNGGLYRAQTPKDSFPDGFSVDTTVEVMREPDSNALYEGCSVYRIAGTDKYLLLVEAFGSNGRYYRSWTADSLDGEWSELAATDVNPFVSRNNIENIEEFLECGVEHGELVRQNPDETMTVNTCSMQFMFSCLTGTNVVDGKEYFHYSLGLFESNQ